MENYEICMPPSAAPFAMVHGPIIVDRNLNSGAVHLYTLLWCLGDRMKDGWHSQALLADLLGVTARTIRNGLTKLVEAGLIETTVRRPLPTLIRIVDPHKVYGVFMVQFYDYVKDRSAALRPVVKPPPEDSNRKNSSYSIGKKFPMKKIKGSIEKSTHGPVRSSLEESEKGLRERKKRQKPKGNTSNTPKKTPGLRKPTMLVRNPSRWGGGKFYLYCIECARIKGVPVRDPYEDYKDLKRSRYAREMNYARKAFANKGYSPDRFLNLLDLIFDRWDAFAQFFHKEQFSVYDLRRHSVDMRDLEQQLTGSTSLGSMEDFEEDQSPADRIGQIHYLDEEEE